MQKLSVWLLWVTSAGKYAHYKHTPQIFASFQISQLGRVRLCQDSDSGAAHSGLQKTSPGTYGWQMQIITGFPWWQAHKEEKGLRVSMKAAILLLDMLAFVKYNVFGEEYYIYLTHTGILCLSCGNISEFWKSFLKTWNFRGE